MINYSLEKSFDVWMLKRFVIGENVLLLKR